MKQLIELRKMSEDIYFRDQDHTYNSISNPDRKYKSVSGWTKNAFPQFNQEYWSLYKALERSGYSIKKGSAEEGYYWIDNEYISVEDAHKLPMDTTPEIIVGEWDAKKNHATDLGTKLHLVYEDMWRGERSRGDFHSIFSIKKNNPHLVLVDTEVTVGSDELGVWGKLDALLLNMKAKKFQIRDLKTDAEIKQKNPWEKMYPPFQELDSCNFNQYALKINMYRYLIERSTSIVIDDEMYIDHVSKVDYAYTEYKVPYLELNDDLVRQIMSGENKNLLNFDI